MINPQKDYQVRTAAFDWLTRQVDLRGDVLSRRVLEQGFSFKGVRVPLMSPQGIFKPAILDLPISITTVFGGPYDDVFSPQDGLLEYKYRGNDPRHRDNVGLRRVMEIGLPLVYFHAILKGRYLAAWPVFIVGDNPDHLTFKVALDESAAGERLSDVEVSVADPAVEGRRVYITSTFRRRVHQQAFRERVLKAYKEQCALCRLRHRELLDAAHIIPDSEPEGEPLVRNGLALCKLHHAAFDKFILGVTPNYVVEVRSDVLDEVDGPMLKFGLQGMHRQTIIVPRAKDLRPDPDLLAWRYEHFKRAG
jgi:putative restriction endonuclease